MGVISGLCILSQAEVSDPNLLSAGLLRCSLNPVFAKKGEERKTNIFDELICLFDVYKRINSWGDTVQS